MARHAKRQFHGLPLRTVCNLTGLPWVTVYRHAVEHKKISPENALTYERTLGIPRSALRPDLWEPNKEAAPHEPAEGGPSTNESKETTA